jgi:hypothetical protein
MSDIVYRPWDREEKLGPPPWKHDDPKLIAWQEAHGHDVRLKCYREFGCIQLELLEEESQDAATRLSAVLDELEQGPLGESAQALLDACKPQRDHLRDVLARLGDAE